MPKLVAVIFVGFLEEKTMSSMEALISRNAVPRPELKEKKVRGDEGDTKAP